MDENHPSLALEVAGQSISARLDLAIKRGGVVRHENGSLSLAHDYTNDAFIERVGNYHPPCRFLNAFLFWQIYAESTVPFGCRECYKIKISSRT
ncbi:MAG: hypothetical protein J2P55_06280, partial [Rhizobiales bacterium]|nr:hypothetical protein [Hyphomicrobiales bacterium]